jgi:hypothetical protein
VDPACNTGFEPETRGGNWTDLPLTARAIYRSFPSNTGSPTTGVRCAVSLR